MITQNRLIKTCGLVICFFGLCGCGQIETIAKRQIQKEADIQSSEEYVKYESIKQNEDYSDFLNDYDVNEDTGEVVKKDNNLVACQADIESQEQNSSQIKGGSLLQCASGQAQIIQEKTCRSQDENRESDSHLVFVQTYCIKENSLCY